MYISVNIITKYNNLCDNKMLKNILLAKKIAIKRFIFIWCWKQGLNLRPADYETAALPTELLQHFKQLYYIIFLCFCLDYFLLFFTLTA